MNTSGMVFRAPWSLSLRLVTTLSSGVLIGIAVIGISMPPGNEFVWLGSMVALPLLILFGSALFMIRGYELTKDKLLVRRLGWKSVVDLSGLKGVEINPDAMKRSLRSFGNGGLFCFAGKFWNRELGSYRAFATDPRLAVILRLATRTIVVTPDDPTKFKSQLERLGLLK
ncbi:MAG TPA: PH domain-containing protein [Woeseiaceae bacterium]|nr:PH domain-containing protein [Woeseiaceae bacterium]